MTTKNKAGEKSSVGLFPDLDDKKDPKSDMGLYDKKILDAKTTKIPIIRLLDFEGTPKKIFIHQGNRIWREYDLDEFVKMLEDIPEKKK